MRCGRWLRKSGRGCGVCIRRVSGDSSGSNIRRNVDVFANQRRRGALGGLGGIRVGQQPLVAGPQPGVLIGFGGNVRLCGVGAGGQRHQHPETLVRVGVTGGVVQRGGVHLHQRAGGPAAG